MTSGWGTRTVRAAVFAAVCVLLAALGHVLMSGRHVPAWALACGTLLTGAAAWCLAGRERGLPTVVGLVVAAQTALHEGFSLAQPRAAGPGMAGGAGGMSAGDTGAGDMGAMDVGATHMGGTHMGAMDMGSAHMGSIHMGAMDMGSAHVGSMHMDSMDLMDIAHMGAGHTGAGSSSLGMLAAHLLAALLGGLWLAYGERAAFRLLRAVAGWLAAPLRLLLALPAPTHRPRTGRPRRRSARAPRLLLLSHAITTRGPPAGTAVA
ncbi:hypothetical protein [Streptomyces justiciae]|uniref:PE-PGRS family protein n=1 Tax=Streptomyces justiciae TaxID=2780140 RepID=A0ABU3LRI7_9ACTN|nr:hypothetical protein [Streptomyces justiciae]MDT7841825.1 hypothetical protein [Streptomyces justiciae]